MKRTVVLKLKVSNDEEYAEAIRRLTADPAVADFSFTGASKELVSALGVGWAHMSASEHASQR